MRVREEREWSMSIFYRDKEISVLVMMVRACSESSTSEEKQMLGIEPEERLMMNMLMRLCAYGAD